MSSQSYSLVASVLSSEASELAVDHATGQLHLRAKPPSSPSLPSLLPMHAEIEAQMHALLDLRENVLYFALSDLVALDLVHGQWIVLSAKDHKRAIQVCLLSESDATSDLPRHEHRTRVGWVAAMTFHNLSRSHPDSVPCQFRIESFSFPHLKPCFPTARHVLLGALAVPGLADLSEADVQCLLKAHFQAERRLLFANDCFRVPLAACLAQKSILGSEGVSPYLFFQVMSIKSEGEDGDSQGKALDRGHWVDMAHSTSLSLSGQWLRFAQSPECWSSRSLPCPLWHASGDARLFEQAYPKLYDALWNIVHPATCSLASLPSALLGQDSLRADSVSDYQKDLERLCRALALRKGYHFFLFHIHPLSDWKAMLQKMLSHDRAFGACFMLLHSHVDSRLASLKGLVELLERELAMSFVLISHSNDEGLEEAGLKGSVGDAHRLSMPRCECSELLLKDLVRVALGLSLTASIDAASLARRVKGCAMSTIEKWIQKAYRSEPSCLDFSWLDSRLSSLAGPVVPNVQWTDLGGLDPELRAAIRRRIELPLAYPSLYPLPAHSSGSISGLLLTGSPGTGKTLLAKVLATTLQLHFFAVKGPELLDAYVGESERHVRALFKRAKERSPSLIFFDELDALASMRGSSGESSATDRVVSQLFAEMDGLSSTGHGLVFLVAATNRPDLLDPAFFRPGRFAQRFELKAAETQSQIHEILVALTRKFTLHPSVDLIALSQRVTRPATGAQLYAMCSDAALSALGRLVEQQRQADEQDGDTLAHSSSKREALVIMAADFKY